MRLPWTDYLLVRRSGLFDERYYLQNNPDCRRSDVDPLSHFLKFGYKEGRNPSAEFNTAYYLETNQDVRSAGVNPLVHYLKFGRKEGRRTLPEELQPQISLEAEPVIFSAVVNGQRAETISVTPTINTPGVPLQDLQPEELVSDRIEIEEPAPVVAPPKGQPQELIFAIDSVLPKSLVVGKGTSILIKGWCFSPGQKIVDLRLKIGERKSKVYNHSIYRDDVLYSYIGFSQDDHSVLHSGFWGLVKIDPVEAEQLQTLSLLVTTNKNKEISQSLGDILLIPEIKPQITRPLKLDPTQPRLAICLASYNPPMELFKTQVQSIKNQTFKNWICIINDDHSRLDIYDQICAVIGKDKRFFIFRNEDRLGHYHNFESALQKVPPGIDFVAFSDQDDEWYPNKLEKTLFAFKSEDDLLVYCDMDVLDSNGEKISGTYWFNRENNFTSLQTLLYANTVTGAATVFRASLLKDILPFPLKLGDQYHDHWVACAVLSRGNICYVDEPLYAYKQHGSNAYGIQSKIGSYTLLPEVPQYIKQLNNLSILKHEVRVTLDNLEASYNSYLLRLILLTDILLSRISPIEQKKRKILAQVRSSERSSAGLLAHSIGYLTHKGPSLGYELYALRSYLGHHLRNFLFRLYAGTRINQIRAKAGSQMSHSTITPIAADKKAFTDIAGEDGMVRLLKQMVSPLLLDISADEPKRVNIVMATVDFNYIFGGYLAMFNMAKKIGQFGHKPRIVIVEPCDYKPEEWRKQILAYPGLEDLFDFVETTYHYDRSFLLKVNPEDVFIATSCWTAHIASRTAKSLNDKKIIFFAQEYEPIFFPMSSMHALSHQSYFLPQYTIFSTELLRQYFRVHRIGVYKSSPVEGDENSMVINNAINPFVISIQDISERKRKKFLFYARPEAHAARNLYELGILGLENAIRLGVFSDEWEFYGIGTIGNNRQLSLGSGFQLSLLPKVSLKEYLELIPSFDLGMSLMLSPHPSLVPLEMAAAGIPAITNIFENKTEAELKKISTNLIGIDPTIEGITLGLQEGIARVYDYPERIAGARINWPTDWNQVFDKNFKTNLNRMMRKC